MPDNAAPKAKQPTQAQFDKLVDKVRQARKGGLLSLFVAISSVLAQWGPQILALIQQILDREDEDVARSRPTA